MKLNNAMLKKIFLVLPAALLVVALLVVALVGFNKTIDFKKYYQFDVQFNTTLESADYSAYKTRFAQLAVNSNVKLYSQEQINENINGGLRIKVLDNSKLSDEVMSARLEDYKNKIQDVNDINENATIVIQSEVIVLPHAWSRSFWMGLLTIIVSAAVIFFYVWFRFEIKLSLAYLLSVLMSQCMLFSCIAILRIPVGLNFMIPYFVAFVVLTVIMLVVFNKVRELNVLDNKQNNNIIVQRALCDTKLVNLILISGLSIVAVALVAAYSVNTLFAVLQILFSIIAALYVFAYILLPTWVGMYNRNTDRRLLVKVNKQTKSNNDNKLIV